jgi:hypothetical protein
MKNGPPLGYRNSCCAFKKKNYLGDTVFYSLLVGWVVVIISPYRGKITATRHHLLWAAGCYYGLI